MGNYCDFFYSCEVFMLIVVGKSVFYFIIEFFGVIGKIDVVNKNLYI